MASSGPSGALLAGINGICGGRQLPRGGPALNRRRRASSGRRLAAGPAQRFGDAAAPPRDRERASFRGTQLRRRPRDVRSARVVVPVRSSGADAVTVRRCGAAVAARLLGAAGTSRCLRQRGRRPRWLPLVRLPRLPPPCGAGACVRRGFVTGANEGDAGSAGLVSYRRCGRRQGARPLRCPQAQRGASAVYASSAAATARRPPGHYRLGRPTQPGAARRARAVPGPGQRVLDTVEASSVSGDGIIRCRTSVSGPRLRRAAAGVVCRGAAYPLHASGATQPRPWEPPPHASEPPLSGTCGTGRLRRLPGLRRWTGYSPSGGEYPPVGRGVRRRAGRSPPGRGVFCRGRGRGRGQRSDSPARTSAQRRGRGLGCRFGAGRPFRLLIGQGSAAVSSVHRRRAAPPAGRGPSTPYRGCRLAPARPAWSPARASAGSLERPARRGVRLLAPGGSSSGATACGPASLPGEWGRPVGEDAAVASSSTVVVRLGVVASGSSSSAIGSARLRSSSITSSPCPSPAPAPPVRR